MPSKKKDELEAVQEETADEGEVQEGIEEISQDADAVEGSPS